MQLYGDHHSRDSLLYFFLSSRRQHTRWNCDWSSDVCSSDLFNRRMTKGVQITSSYTLSRAYDNGQTSNTFTPTFSVPFNSFDQSGEGALSSFDRRHKFVYSMVYTSHYKNKDNKAARALLNGWTFAPIFNWFSGARYTANLTGSIAPVSFGFSGAACTP